MLPCATPDEALNHVCDDEANGWRLCIEAHLGDKSARQRCGDFEKNFDQCVARWRAEVGPAVCVEGENEGEPPAQCAALSCLVGECLRKTSYDFARCTPPMECFKHCVKGLYGSDYVKSNANALFPCHLRRRGLTVCCPFTTSCTEWGCVNAAANNTVYVSTHKLVWVNAMVQLFILFAGIVSFAVSTLYYCYRRRRNTARIDRSRSEHIVVNDVTQDQGDAVTSLSLLTASKTARRLKLVSDLDGRCCGCGAVADAVLLPCRHAVCCFACSAHATYCPFCKLPSNSRLRLYPV